MSGVTDLALTPLRLRLRPTNQRVRRRRRLNGEAPRCLQHRTLKE